MDGWWGCCCVPSSTVWAVRYCFDWGMLGIVLPVVDQELPYHCHLSMDELLVWWWFGVGEFERAVACRVAA